MTPYAGYILFNLLGLAVGFLAIRHMRFEIYDRLSGMDKARVAMGLVLGVVLGAKVPVLLSYGPHVDFFWTGKSIYGALLGAYTGVNVAKRFFHINGNYGDRYVVPLCLAAALGNIGCFVNGCCGGRATACWVHATLADGTWVHPTQLYTSAFHLTCAVLFYTFYRRRLWFQLHFVIYLMLYSLFRFLIEFIRNEPRVLLGLTIYQWIALICVPYFSHVIFRRLREGVHLQQGQEQHGIP